MEVASPRGFVFAGIAIVREATSPLGSTITPSGRATCMILSPSVTLRITFRQCCRAVSKITAPDSVALSVEVDVRIPTLGVTAEAMRFRHHIAAHHDEAKQSDEWCP